VMARKRFLFLRIDHTLRGLQRQEVLAAMDAGAEPVILLTLSMEIVGLDPISRTAPLSFQDGSADG
jgi:hypothetical protein